MKVLKEIKKQIYRIGIVLAIISLLILVNVLLIKIYFKTSLFDFIVSDMGVFNDETHYWHAISTFSVAGFHGGYYTILELPAKASFSHFGPHGPMFPVIYGILGRLLGWHTYSGFLCNIVVLALALGIFAYLSQPTERQLLAVGFLLLTFWPVLLFLPSNMQQSLHQAIGIILAGAFYRLIKAKPDSTRWNVLMLCLLISIASLIRFTWTILFIPCFLLATKRRVTWFDIGRILFCSIILITFFIFVKFYWSAPNVSSPTSQLVRRSNNSVWNGINLFVKYAKTQFVYFISFDKDDHIKMVQQLLRYQVLLLVMFNLVQLVLTTRNKNFLSKSQQAKIVVFHLINLGTMPVLLILLARVGWFRDYRVLAPHLLLSILLFALLSRWWVVRVIIITNLAFIFSFAVTYNEVRAHNFVYDRSSIMTFQQQTRHILRYKEHDNPWCNTLVIGSTITPFVGVGVPGGIGISTIRNGGKVDLPLKSKFILLKPPVFSTVTQRGVELHLKPLEETIHGTLYLNLDSQCTR